MLENYFTPKTLLTGVKE